MCTQQIKTYSTTLTVRLQLGLKRVVLKWVGLIIVLEYRVTLENQSVNTGS